MSTAPKIWNTASLPYARWVGLAALFIAELLAVTIRFDGDTLRTDRPWFGLVARSGSVVRFCLLVALATLVLAGPRCHAELKRHFDRLRHIQWSLPGFLGNLAAFSVFYSLSICIFDAEGPGQPTDWVLVVAWVLAGMATVVLWAIAILPADLWPVLMSRSAGSLVAGIALGTAVHVVGGLAQAQWEPLSRATILVVNSLLCLVFSDTICQPDQYIVGTPSYLAAISAQCSGYEGVGMIGVLVSIALWLFRREFRFPRAFALLPLAMALIWLANAFRIALLIAIGTWGYPELASGAFHSLAGWFFFLVLGLGLIAGARRMPFFSTLEAETRSRPAALDGAYLMPAMAIIATAMVTGTFSPGFDRYYAARVIAATAAFFVYRKSYAELRVTLSWQAVAIGCGVFALWIVMEPYASAQSAGMPIRSGLGSLPHGWAAAWLIFRVVGSVLTVPLAEELAFRGYLTRRLISADFQAIRPGQFTWWSFLVSSLLFGALHGRFVAGTLAGMAYAMAYRRRGELTDAVVAHGVTNGLIAFTVLTTGSWSLWS
jgi:exosortase E/protease (VPEID-CTERM system)